jgi:hypothetical protein
VIGCSGSVYQPKEIALTCADGDMRSVLARFSYESRPAVGS